MIVPPPIPSRLRSASSMDASSPGTSCAGARNRMFPLASTEETRSNPSPSNTPRRCALDMFFPLGAIPRSRAAYASSGGVMAPRWHTVATREHPRPGRR